jgi:hypothetical protein
VAQIIRTSLGPIIPGGSFKPMPISKEYTAVQPAPKVSPNELWEEWALKCKDIMKTPYRICYTCYLKLSPSDSLITPSGIPMCNSCIVRHIQPSFVEETL